MTFFTSIRSLTRSGEWLTWKIPVFLTAALVVIHNAGKTIDHGLAWQMSRVVCGMVVGAVFVSVLNDFTDLEDDRRAGKPNRLEPLSPVVRRIVLLLALALVSAYVVFAIDGAIPRFWYIAACLSFVVYSVPPFRIKKKGAWGGLGDALGASLFPTLFVASEMSQELDYGLSANQWVALPVWAIAQGLRGILWHQFRDRAYDASIGSRTFATENRLRTLRLIEPMIVTVEMLAFLVFCGSGLLPLMGGLLCIHLLMVVLVRSILDVRHVMVVSPPDKEQYMLYGSFYQLLCPLALMFTLSGLSFTYLFLSLLLILVALPDLRINYYLIKRMVYKVPKVREWIVKRDAIRASRRS